MTPAILHGYNAYIHRDTNQPCLLQSPNLSDCVQGMLVLGQGSRNRDIIHNHFPNTRNIKVKVEIEILRPVSGLDRRFAGERWRRERKGIWAHAWLWADVESADLCSGSDVPKWTVEDYISGRIRRCDSTSLKVKHEWKAAEDMEHGEIEEGREREVVRGGPGRLTYERMDTYTGW